MAEKFMDFVQKYNPYHDAKGRFTNGGKASFFSIPKNKELASRLKEKEKKRINGLSSGHEINSDSKKENGSIDNSVSIDRNKCRRFKNREEGIAYGDKQAKKDGLNENQTENLIYYTGKGYLSVNKYLRGNGSVEKDEIPKAKQCVKNLSDSIKKVKTEEDMIVYRGISPSALGLQNDKEYKELVGKTVRDKGFMSSSISSDMANNFAEKKIIGGKIVHGAVFEIAVPQGTNGVFADGRSNLEGECEFIMQKNSGIKIVDVKVSRVGKPTVIMAEYVGAEYGK